MAEVQYNPANTDVAGTFFNAANGAQSLMARAQSMRFQREQNAREKERFGVEQEAERVLAPVRAIKAQADVGIAKATIQAAAMKESLRARLANEAPLAQAEFEEAMLIPSFEERSTMLSKIHQKYGWMELLDEGKPLVNEISRQQLQANNSYVLDKKLENDRITAQEATRRMLDATQMRMDQQDENNQLRMQVEAMKAEIERIKAGAAVTNAEANATRAEKYQPPGQKSRLSPEIKKALGIESPAESAPTQTPPAIKVDGYTVTPL